MYKASTLNEESGYNKILEHYNEHKNLDWCKWLEVEQIFPRPGKQGLVGILRSKKDPTIKYVFKLSQYVNYLVQHELTIAKSLNKIGAFCPHFCKGIGGILAKVDPAMRKNGNPFDIQNTKYPIEKEVMLLQHLRNTTKFYNHVRSERVTDDSIYSTIKQTLMAISISQLNCNFTHYDLHSNNIMMKKCDKDLVFLYVLDKDNQYCIPTHGSYPVIIDYGFSYADTLNNGPLWPSLGHTDIGFMSNQYDDFADPKLFLVTVSSEIHEKRPNKKSRKFKNIVKNMFGKLNIDWSSGWDEGVKKSASDRVIDMLSKYNDSSDLFKKYDHFSIDLIQSLIILPLQKQSYSNIDKAYKVFLTEFVKIENEVGNLFYSLYILKGIVDIAREVRSDYYNKTYRPEAVDHFRSCVYEHVDKIAKYCRLKHVHFEKMLCGLLCFSRCVEGVLYDIIHKRSVEKERQYSKLPLQTIEQMYAAIEINIPDKYEFNKNSTVMIIDCVKNTCTKIQLTEEDTQLINSTDSISRGPELNRIYQENII